MDGGDGWIAGQINGLMDGWIDGWREGIFLDRGIDGGMGGWMRGIEYIETVGRSPFPETAQKCSCRESLLGLS